MSIDQNKAVVRRFLAAISSGGNMDLIDELVAPNYVNRGMGNVDLAGFKAMLAGMQGASDVAVEDLVAEGDAVVLRSTMNIALPSGRRFLRGQSPTIVFRTGRSWKTTR
jgi:ketosteroid isomerase-like protein